MSSYTQPGTEYFVRHTAALKALDWKADHLGGFDPDYNLPTPCDDNGVPLDIKPNMGMDATVPEELGSQTKAAKAAYRTGKKVG